MGLPASTGFSQRPDAFYKELLPGCGAELTDEEEKLDELIYLADNDTELKEALVWVDSQALQKGISMVDMVQIILEKKIATNSAREWVKNLQNKFG